MLTQLGHSRFVGNWIILLSISQMLTYPSFQYLGCHSQIVFTGVVVFPLHPAVVTNIFSSAFARNRTVGLPADLTIACWRWRSNFLLQYSSILAGDLACHVRNGPIADLNRVGVDNGSKNIIFGKISEANNKDFQFVNFL